MYTVQVIHIQIPPDWLSGSHTYRLITAYLLLRVNLDKIKHAR